MSIDSAKPHTANERVKMSDLVDIVELDNKWKLFRFLDTDHLAVATHWIDITTKQGKATRFPKICVSWNPKEEEDYEGVKCPYCEAGLNRSVTYYVNAIVRDLQEDEPAKKSKPTESEKETRLKSKDSKTWTPVRVVQLTSTTVAKIQGLKDLNKHKVNGEVSSYPVSDDKYGMDVNIKYDESAKTQANKYTVNSGDKSSLEKDELDYLIWNLGDPNLIKKLGQETKEQAEVEVRRLKASGVINTKKDDDDDDDDDDYDMSKSKKNKSFEDDDEDEKPRKKKRSFDDDEEEDEEEEEKPRKKKRSFDDDEEEDEKPRKKNKSFEDDDEDEKPRKKKRSFDDDEEEDEEPRKKKRSFDDEDEKPSKSKRNQSFEDDDEEDEEPRKKKRSSKDSDDYDDDEEEEKPRKKKRSFDDEDDDEEDEEPRKKKRSFDDEDDDEEPRKKKRSSKDDVEEKSSKSKKTRSLVDDDDEEEEKPRKKKRSFDD